MEPRIFISKPEVETDIDLEIAFQVLGTILQKGKISKNEIIAILDSYPGNSYMYNSK
ncbi:MAG: hypothetical protein ACFFG0_05130 [Candidatus Thorarchaeota archaeon]